MYQTFTMGVTLYCGICVVSHVFLSRATTVTPHCLSIVALGSIFFLQKFQSLRENSVSAASNIKGTLEPLIHYIGHQVMDVL